MRSRRPIHATGRGPHLLLLLALFLAACSDEEAAPTAAPAAAPTGPAAKKDGETEEDESAEDEYAYNPIGKRDPFRSFITEKDPNEFKPQTPLQKFDIDQYRLTGIVWGIDRPRALVEDPEGVGHVVELGTYIGKNWGKVTQIASNVVIVTEEYLTPDGALVTNAIKMPLQPTESESQE